MQDRLHFGDREPKPSELEELLAVLRRIARRYVVEQLNGQPDIYLVRAAFGVASVDARHARCGCAEGREGHCVHLFAVEEFLGRPLPVDGVDCPGCRSEGCDWCLGRGKVARCEAEALRRFGHGETQEG